MLCAVSEGDEGKLHAAWLAAWLGRDVAYLLAYVIHVDARNDAQGAALHKHQNELRQGDTVRVVDGDLDHCVCKGIITQAGRTSQDQLHAPQLSSAAALGAWLTDIIGNLNR